MATERKIGSGMDTAKSAADLSSKNRFLVKRVAAGIALCAAGEYVAGVLVEGKAIGLHNTFATSNQVKALAGAAIAVGAKVSSDANGKLRTAVAGDNVLGIAASAAAGDGELVTVDIDRSILEA